jgi:hypothetical protein
MTISLIQPSFASGELSPSLYGRVDLAKYRTGAATMRNMFVNYRGGAASRAGTHFIGVSEQAGTGLPPRLIPFVFNSTQSYALEFGNLYMRVIANGAYVVEASKTITGASKANPCQITSNSHGFSNGDAVYITGISGMTQLNGQTFIVANSAANTFTLTNPVGGGNIDSTSYTAYASGGTVARIYTLVTPWAVADLPLLKFTQSADTMTFVHPSYPPYDLKRTGTASWSLTAITFASTIAAPASITTAANNTTASLKTCYSYCVTAVDANGQESVPSPVGTITNSVDIAVVSGSNNISWPAVTGSTSYNIFMAPPAYNSTVPVGSQFSYIGTAYGLSFVDTNITADATHSPPTHSNPFAISPISSVTITAGGSGYTQTGVTYSITTSTGSGAVLLPVITGGAVSAVIVQNGGSGYAAGDTITFTADGTSATAILVIGKSTGTYPSTVAYFQQRKVFANTPNAPDTYRMSKPGQYANFDVSTPVQDDDAIQGTPWAQQVNGVQAMVPMPGGMVVLTGGGAWQISGGANGTAVTPSQQVATPQAYNGCNAQVPPITVNYDILYVQEKGSVVRDLSYNFYAQIYTGTDMSVLSNHLFATNTILQWAWCEEPYKIVWCVRDDGVLLSFTYLKEQDIYAWARHDTFGLFKSVCTVSEPPVNALYCVVQRKVNGNWYYYVERMDNRIWTDVESVWCVDAGLSYPQNTPAATLTFSSASTSASVVASAGVFSSGNVGDVIRAGGGIGTITSYSSSTSVSVTLSQPITDTIPNDPNNNPVPFPTGAWTQTTPVSVVTGLGHLEGCTVAILADGSVAPSQIVSGGSVTLATPATAITVGLPFQAQLQTLYLDSPQAGGSTIQGKRKNIYSVTVRVEASRGIKVGQTFDTVTEFKDRGNDILAGQPIPLFTGDKLINITPLWTKPGQVCIQQDYPMPCNVLAVIPEVVVGDSNG